VFPLGSAHENENVIHTRHFSLQVEVMIFSPHLCVHDESKSMVAYIIKIEDLPTFSGIKTDNLIGFCVVDLLRNHLQMLNLSYF